MHTWYCNKECNAAYEEAASPFVELELLELLHLRDEGLERLRVRLEHLEEGDGAHALDVRLQGLPAIAQDGLLFIAQVPLGLQPDKKRRMNLIAPAAASLNTDPNN